MSPGHRPTRRKRGALMSTPQSPARRSFPESRTPSEPAGQRRALCRTNAVYLDETVAWSNPPFLLPPIPRRRLASARADAAGVDWARSRPFPAGLSSHAVRVGRLVRWVPVALLCHRARRLGGREDPSTSWTSIAQIVLETTTGSLIGTRPGRRHRRTPTIPARATNRGHLSRGRRTAAWGSLALLLASHEPTGRL
jgi:hypothetical protein